MALTITIEGLGVLSNAESTTGWGVTGSGGASISLDAEIYYQGSGCINSKLSSGKSGWIWYNYGSALNFTTTYSGQRVYIWYQITTPKAMDTKANVGYSVRMGSSTTVYREWVLGGNDDLNGYTGGWQCAVIDPTSAGTSDTGSYAASAVQYIGIYYNGNTASRAENVYVDTIAVGSGIRAIGTETTSGEGIKEIADYCIDLSNRAWGMIQEREGIYYLYGGLTIGGTTSNTTITTGGRVLKWGDFEYWTGSAWATGIGLSANQFVIEDHASYTTSYTDGTIVGTDKGRSGNVYIGAGSIRTEVDFYGGNNTGSITKVYGANLTDIDFATTGLYLSDDADHHFYSVTFQGCGQVRSAGGKIRNCTFAETTSTASALRWDESIDIQDCNFIANTTGAAIQHPSSTGTPYTHTNLVMSGNTYDVNNTSGSPITVTKSGTSNGSTHTGSGVTFQSSLTITINVQDKDTDPIQNVVVGIYKVSDRTELMKEETTAAGVATEPYVGGTPVDVEIRCRKASSADSPKYRNFSTLATLTGDFDLLVTLQEDPNNNATT